MQKSSPREEERPGLPAVRTLGSPGRTVASGGWLVQPGRAIPVHCRMITCANVRDVTLSSPGEHVERALGPRSAVEVGFEPTEGLPPHTLSRRAPSATRRLHRG